MGTKCQNQLRSTIIEVVDENGPAITLEGLLDEVEGEASEIVEVLEELQHQGDIEHDILLWRESHSSGTS